jgi:hypothetical protein
MFLKEWDWFFGIDDDCVDGNSVKTAICHGTGKVDAYTSPHRIKQGTVPRQAIAPSCRVITS